MRSMPSRSPSATLDRMRKTPSTETPVADSRPGLDPEVPTPRTRICTPEVSPCVFETSRLGAIEVSRFTSLIPDRAICSGRSEEHTSELQSLMRISYAVFCLKTNKQTAEKTQAYNTQASCTATKS